VRSGFDRRVRGERARATNEGNERQGVVRGGDSYSKGEKDESRHYLKDIASKVTEGNLPPQVKKWTRVSKKEVLTTEGVKQRGTATKRTGRWGWVLRVLGGVGGEPTMRI